MTNEQAIKLLHRLQDEQFDGQHGDERREALEMAVRALSGEGDTIYRQAVDKIIDALLENDNLQASPSVWHGLCMIKQLPSAQPERLTDDAFEAIRIHLNAYKEKLCNQRRWKEAEEYQRIIDRFMAFASAQPERKKGGWEEIEVIPEAYDIAGIKTWASKMRCNHCGFTTFAVEGCFAQYNFCPSCGADMRKVIETDYVGLSKALWDKERGESDETD